FFSAASRPARLSPLSLHDALPIFLRHILKIPASEVDAYAVAPDMVERRTTIDVDAALADGYDQFDLVMEILRCERVGDGAAGFEDRKSTRLHSSHVTISYAGFCLT